MDNLEKEMIDIVNRNAEEKNKQFDISGTQKKPATRLVSLFNKNDKRILARGVRRTILALVTAMMFAMSVFCLVEVATARGYLAVFLFFAAIVTMALAFVLLYAQGILQKTTQESKGESK